MRWLLIATVALFVGEIAAGQETRPEGPTCARAKQALAALMADAGLVPENAGCRDERAGDTDVLHYWLDIQIDPDAAWVGGTNTMTVRSLVDNLTVFRFRLHEAFAITALRVGDVPVGGVRIDSATVEVTLDRPYNVDDVFDLCVEYWGQPPGASYWGGITFTTHSGNRIVYTLSEPWFAYTWWPAKDDLEDKTTADLWFAVPDTLVVASNGALQGAEDVGVGWRRYRWKTEYPTADYLYCFAATNYNQVDATWTYADYSMPLQFFIYPEDDTAYNRARWLQTLDMLTTYSDLFGLYPFVDEKYGMLEWNWGGGMEHQTITSIFGSFTWEEGIAHELAHQWWGDSVTCATWHDIWLNEGFATYGAGLWWEHDPGSGGLFYYMANHRPYNVNGSVYCYNISDPGRIFDYDLSYQKGAWVLHMLRHVVGDDQFYAIFAAYRTAFEGGAATTADFQAVAEQVAGRDLSWFFDEWVYGVGAPAYEVAWRPCVVAGHSYVELYVKQVQPASYPLFTMPVDIQTVEAAGSYLHKVWNDAPAEHLLLPVTSPPITNLVLDPTPWILWTARNSTAFVEGPPKIVAVRPGPGSIAQAGDVQVVFHKAVVVDESQFTLVGQQAGPVSFSFDYDPSNYTVTLHPTSALTPDTYTLTVADSIVDVAAGLALDGELVKPDGADPLPSGDGLPGGIAVSEFVVGQGGETDVLHYALDIEINPTSHWIGGSNTLTVQSLTDNLDLFRFRLHSTFTVTDVRVGPVPVSWTQADEANIDVVLDRPYSAGEVFDLYVEYNGIPQSEGSFGSIVFGSHSGHAEVNTESDPWYAYTWWPAKDDLLDKTTADLWFTVPSPMKVASNGALQGVDDLGSGKVRYRWKMDIPTEDYLYQFAATNYDEFTGTWNYHDYSMPLQFFIYPEHNNAGSRAAWLNCGSMLTVFSDLYGLYPFVTEKYGMCEWQRGGAMEHQTMTSMCCYSEDIIAHELAHQWWGDAVTYATWYDIWLSEGFATYSEALWEEHKPGSPGEPALHPYMAQHRPGDLSGSVYCYSPNSIEEIFNYNTTYLKAGWVLHMLRRVVGYDTFLAILAAYRAQYEGGAATTEDFEQVAETVAGRDLAWFFDEWVYGFGAPSYVYAWRTLVIDGVSYLELSIEQVQNPPDSVFTMPIDILTTDDQGVQNTYVVWNDDRKEYLLFAVDSANLGSAALDPTPWILWSNTTEVVIEEGPPKIVTMNPAPGAAVAAADVSAIEIVFHKDIVASAADFTLVGQRGGPVACAFAYDSSRYAVTLTPLAALGSDTYTLTVSDQIVDTAAGLALDGELVKPDSPQPLPSGDGVPGGSAVAEFAVLVRGDVNCDGTVDFGDINPFVLLLSNESAWRAAYPGCPVLNGDINGDGTAGQASFGDINPFVALLTGG
jgi:aminopeptidase N